MPTIKQKRVAQKLLENAGTSVSSAMKAAGYKKGTYKNPQELTRSLGWAELMNEYLPEEALLKTHKALLKDKNWRARDAALEKGYKLLGKYSAQKIMYEDPLSLLTDEELDKRLAELEAQKGR